MIPGSSSKRFTTAVHYPFKHNPIYMCVLLPVSTLMNKMRVYLIPVTVSLPSLAVLYFCFSLPPPPHPSLFSIDLFRIASAEAQSRTVHLHYYKCVWGGGMREIELTKTKNEQSKIVAPQSFVCLFVCCVASILTIFPTADSTSFP